MTREEKINEARRLRSQGLTARQIAEHLGANESTVRNWYLGQTCRCGAPLDGSKGVKSTECIACMNEATRGRDQQILVRWNEGLGASDIGEMFDLTQGQVCRIADRRRGEGWAFERRNLHHRQTSKRFALIARRIRAGRTFREIADELGTTKESVITMASRARRDGFDMPYVNEVAA